MEELRYDPMTNWTKLTLSGKITYEVTQSMKSQFEAILAQMGEPPVLVCDVHDVSFLDSSGIGFLVFLNNKIRQKNGCCFLYQPNDVVRKTLDLVQLLDFFAVLETESDLIACSQIQSGP